MYKILQTSQYPPGSIPWPPAYFCQVNNRGLQTIDTKVDERLKGWGKLQLSFAARGVIKIIEARMRTFLWHGNTGTRLAKVAWLVL
ncbi:UNVERIFIED_CONTAM: hypothetical protein Slati_2947100 [Sesamum latifolium]|uniref:Uncharacterized protein n=1 Tax=Sesamum latifolium TaxID=2727402 RepID=A0AAW2VES2_9LAMI